MAMRGIGRDAGVDAVRGLALLSMFVAHAAPVPGPGDILILSEYLTAPLFAVLVGVGAELSSRRGGRGIVAAAIRGGVLVVVGLLLERAGSQVIVILVYLGVLTWVMALLARLPRLAVGLVAWFLFILSPLLRTALTDDWVGLLAGGDTFRARLMEIFFVGSSYRLTALVIWACLGVLVTRTVLRRRRSWMLGAALVIAAGLILGGLDRSLGLVDVVPYSGTHVEIVFDALLAVGVLLIGASVARAASGRWVRSLADMGCMSLTLYTLHILWLAFVARVLWPGRADDAWSILASLVVGAVAFAGAWNAIPALRSWGRGPLEGVTDAAVRAGASWSRRRVSAG